MPRFMQMIQNTEFQNEEIHQSDKKRKETKDKRNPTVRRKKNRNCIDWIHRLFSISNSKQREARVNRMKKDGENYPLLQQYANFDAHALRRKR